MKKVHASPGPVQWFRSSNWEYFYPFRLSQGSDLRWCAVIWEKLCWLIRDTVQTIRVVLKAISLFCQYFLNRKLLIASASVRKSSPLHLISSPSFDRRRSLIEKKKKPELFVGHSIVGNNIFLSFYFTCSVPLVSISAVIYPNPCLRMYWERFETRSCVVVSRSCHLRQFPYLFIAPIMYRMLVRDFVHTVYTDHGL